MTPDEKFKVIVTTVCRHFNVPRDVLMGPRTGAMIVRARHMSMALCYAMIPEWTTIEIGRRHNRKSGHCITLYAKNKILAHPILRHAHDDLVDMLIEKGLPR